MSTVKSLWLDCLFLTIIFGAFFFLLLPDRPLLVPDGARYSEIAREMLVLHDFITPHVNFVKYFEKPPLFFWLTALAIKIGGLNLWSVRSVNALLALLGCLLTYFTARKLYGRTTGILAACILGTNVIYFMMLHVVNLDLSLTVFLSMCFYALLLSTQGTHQRIYIWLAFVAAALAVMTKGLIGIVFPIAVMSVWMFITHERCKLFLWSSIPIFLALVLPWHILVQMKNPEFFNFYIINQHILRYATMEAHHYGPVWYYIPILLMGFAPWIVFLPQALKASFPTKWQDRQQYKNELFFIIWAVIIFVFYSFSKSKLIPYILPVIPPLAILTANYLANGLKMPSIPRGIKIGFNLFLIFSCVVTLFLFLVTRFYPELPDPMHVKIFFYLAGVFLLIGSVISYVLQKLQKLLSAIITIIVSMIIVLLFLLAGLPYTDDHTILPLAQKLKPMLKPDDEVVSYNKYFQDLPFYLERRVTVVNWTNELSYGMQHQDTSSWMIQSPEFWKRWHSDKRIYFVSSFEEFNGWRQRHPNEKFYVIASTTKNVLLTNGGLRRKERA